MSTTPNARLCEICRCGMGARRGHCCQKRDEKHARWKENRAAPGPPAGARPAGKPPPRAARGSSGSGGGGGARSKKGGGGGAARGAEEGPVPAFLSECGAAAGRAAVALSDSTTNTLPPRLASKEPLVAAPQLRVIGVTGPSGVGKTTLAGQLALALGSGAMTSAIVSQDMFLKGACAPTYAERILDEENCRHMESPSHVDWEAMAGAFEAEAALLQGPRRVIVIEGYLLLHSPPAVLSSIDTMIMLTAGAEECLQRRARRSARAPAEADALRQYFLRHVWPSYLNYTYSIGLARQRDGQVTVVDTAGKDEQGVLAELVEAASA